MDAPFNSANMFTAPFATQMPIYFVIQIALRHKVFDRYTMNIMHIVTRFNAAITLPQNIEKKKRKMAI